MKEKQILTITDFINQSPKETQSVLSKIRNTIMTAAPLAKETIKYQMPTFVLKENLVHFAAYKKHIGFYPTPSAIEKFKTELTTYKTSKGAIQFPLDKPIPYELIEQIVLFRMNEVSKK